MQETKGLPSTETGTRSKSGMFEGSDSSRREPLNGGGEGEKT